MRLHIQKITANHIIGEGAVKSFLYECVHALKLGIGFHPDNSFQEYIAKATGKKVFTDEEAEKLDNALNECLEQCNKLNLDIYALTLHLTQHLFDSGFIKPVTEEYNGFELRTTPNGIYFTTLIYKNGQHIGGSFKGPYDKITSIEAAKQKIASGKYKR